MSAAAIALRAAIQTRLATDAPLIALIGADRIHDEAPRGAQGVYVVHGELAVRDWSTAGEPACEHDVGLVVWAADSASSRLALTAAARIQETLDEAALALAGHRLIDLRWRESRLARDARSGRAAITMRFRAVTETI